MAKYGFVHIMHKGQRATVRRTGRKVFLAFVDDQGFNQLALIREYPTLQDAKLALCAAPYDFAVAEAHLARLIARATQEAARHD